MSKAPARKSKAAPTNLGSEPQAPKILDSEPAAPKVPSSVAPPSEPYPVFDPELKERAQKQMDAIDFAALVGLPTEVVEEFLPLLEERTYSPDVKPKEPVARFSVGNVSICTPGNLTTFSAPAKVGKSAAVGAKIASTFCAEGADCLGFVSQNPDGLAVVHFDTEQSLFDHWQGIQRIVKRAKVQRAPRWLRSFCLTSLSPLEIRNCIRITAAEGHHLRCDKSAGFFDALNGAVSRHLGHDCAPNFIKRGGVAARRREGRDWGCLCCAASYERGQQREGEDVFH